jgi:Tyrosine phosphatase family
MSLERFRFPHHTAKDHADFVHATEDLPAQAAAALHRLFRTEPAGVTFEGQVEAVLDTPPPPGTARKIWDVLENVAGAGAGIGENLAADLGPVERVLDVIRAHRIEAYTYRVSNRVIRGSRPTPEKVRDLFRHNGVRSTVNLCSEMHHGDTSIIAAAGLTGVMKTEHIPITDNGRPSYPQVLHFFEFLDNPDNTPAYVHCEQGVGRTGVMVACYRLAVNAWRVDTAINEAERFADKMPEQLAFIEEFARALVDPSAGWGAVLAELRYPRSEPPTAPPDAANRDDCRDHGSPRHT